jgi:hypothetical protein
MSCMVRRRPSVTSEVANIKASSALPKSMSDNCVQDRHIFENKHVEFAGTAEREAFADADLNRSSRWDTANLESIRRLESRRASRNALLDLLSAIIRRPPRAFDAKSTTDRPNASLSFVTSSSTASRSLSFACSSASKESSFTSQFRIHRFAAAASQPAYIDAILDDRQVVSQVRRKLSVEVRWPIV